jgi:hypothetical protein
MPDFRAKICTRDLPNPNQEWWPLHRKVWSQCVLFGRDIKVMHKTFFSFTRFSVFIRWCIQKFLDWVDNEICAYLWYCSLRSNIRGYGGKTHSTDSQNSDTIAPSGRELYHLQFSLQAASSEIFGYTVVREFYVVGHLCGNKILELRTVCTESCIRY